jgi:hypothetical protein
LTVTTLKPPSATPPPAEGGTPPPEPAAAQREDDENRALEAAIVAAALVLLLRRLKRVRDGVDRAQKKSATDPAGWLAARQAAARMLRSTTVDLAPVERLLPKAAKLGAKHVGVPLPDGYDPASSDPVRAALDRAEATVRDKLDAAAKALMDGPLDTPGKVADALARTDAAGSAAQAGVGDVVHTAIYDGATAAATAASRELSWQPEIDACLNCQGMAGGVPRHDGRYRPVKVLAPRPMQWLLDGILGPPAHSRCRCKLVLSTHDEAADIRRTADVATAYGWSAYDRLPDLIKGVDLLLRQTRLRPAVRADARANLRAGRFVHLRPAGGLKRAV